MRRRRRAPAPAGGPAGAPEWVVTFTDMISLLVTFFVLLMTFSSLEHYDALKVDSWLTGKRGLHRSRGFLMPDAPPDEVVSASSVERGAHHPHVRPAQKLPEALEEMGQKLDEGYVEVDFERARDGLAIEFTAAACFAPGSAEPSAELERALVELGEVLANYPHLVVAEGFADGSEPRAEQLSLERARAAAELLRASGVPDELLQVSAHAAQRPRADDRSPGGRALNRRVEVRVLSLSKTRALVLEKEGGR